MSVKPAWRQFEIRILTESAMSGITCWQLPTEVRVVTENYNAVRVKSHPDFACGILGFAAFFDAKTTKDQSWDLKKYVFNEAKQHQFDKLEHAFDCGNIAGYLVYFSAQDKVTWVSIGVIRDMVKSGQFKITPETPGVKNQSADKAINLKNLMDKEIAHRVHVMSAHL